MGAFFGANSVNIVVDSSDKDKLECILDEHKKPKVILRIKDQVDPGFLEEPGFHM